MRKRLMQTTTPGSLSLLLALLLAGHGVAQDRKEAGHEAAARRKWEYKVLTQPALINLVNEDKEGKKLIDMLGRNPAPGGAVLITFVLNKLGDDGWELVAVALQNVPFGAAKEPVYYFKRPKRR